MFCAFLQTLRRGGTITSRFGDLLVHHMQGDSDSASEIEEVGGSFDNLTICIIDDTVARFGPKCDAGAAPASCATPCPTID